MTLLLIALVIAALCSWALLIYGNEGFKMRHMISGIAGILLSISTIIVSLGYVVAGWNWLAAEHQAKIINREYNTNYTQEEIFYASNVIETVRQLDRKRFEVNGNINGY